MLFAKLPLKKELDLSYNPIGNFGIHLISTNLGTLILDSCGADEGFVKLGSIQKSQLIKFKMRNSYLGREGVEFEKLLRRRWIDMSWGSKRNV